MGNAKKQLTPDQQFNAIIDRITNDHDDFWLDSIEDQVGDCLTGQSNNEEILKNFELNYSSGSIGIVDFDDLTAEEIRKKIGNDKVLLELLKNSSEILPCDYYIQHNELNSIQIGETEHQIDLCDHEDLQNLLEKFPQLKGKNDTHITAFGNPCDRAILKLNVELFLDEIKSLFKRSKKHKAPVIKLVQPSFKQECPRQRFIKMQLERQGLMGKIIKLKGKTK